MRPSERGFVLVCVLWILAILTVITIGFGRRAMLDARAAAFTLDHTQAMFMARGAVTRGMVELRNKAVIETLYQRMGRTSFTQRWANTLDMLAEDAYYAKPDEDSEKEICRYVIRDEQSLICINNAPEEILDRIEGLSKAAIRKIISRRTGGDDDREPPRPFQTIEEVRELEGIKMKNWYGTEDQAGLRDLLTCWGDSHININTALPDALKCIPDLHDDVIDAIIQYRMGPDGQLGTADDLDFAAIGQIAEKTGVAGESLGPLQQYCTVDSQFFTITGIATRRQGKVTATCCATVLIQGSEAMIIKWREEFLES
jgi:type II secretory pathway component PulK